VLIPSGCPRPARQGAVARHGGVDGPPARVKHGGRVGAHVRDPVVAPEFGAGGRVGPALVEDPADVVVQDALVRLGVQGVTLRSTAEDSKLESKSNRDLKSTGSGTLRQYL